MWSVRFLRLLGLVCLAPLGAGCASVSQQQCLAGDWQTIGYRDGSQGLDPSRLLAHEDACGDHGVKPDRDAYQAGWNEGVALYCSPDNGFELGSAGAQYRNVCPAALAGAFHKSYFAGRQLFLAESEIADLEGVLAARSSELERVTSALSETEQHLVRADATANERLQWLLQAKSLVRQQRDLESEIDSLEVELKSRKDDLASLRLSLADAG